MLKDFLNNISNGVNKHKNNIILVIIIFLLFLLAFALGYLAAKYQEKESIKFEQSVKP